MYLEKIRFLKSEKYIEASIIINNNLAKITFSNNRPSEDILLSGFEILNEYTFENQSNDEYYKFTTLYQNVSENTVILSNDGSIYTEPQELIITLEELKKQKIQLLSSICRQKIIEGVDVEINGISEHFSYNDNDQVNIKELFDLALKTNVSLYYHADGESCKLYTVEQIVSIYTTNATNKMHHITYFNQLKLYVNSLNTKEAVDVISYGDKLTGSYLQTYNEALSQANIGLTTLLSGK